MLSKKTHRKFRQAKRAAETLKSHGLQNKVSPATLNALKDDKVINKVAVIDNLPGRFLKDVAVILAKPISKIFNLSIKSAVFPDPCKLAKLKPLFKKSSRMDHSKLRPISLLPVIPKIFEKNVHDQTICYLVNMTFYKNISPVFELNIQLICVFYT